MRKGKTVIGKDVLSLADGRKVQSVKDLIIGDDNDEIVALLVDEGGLLSSSTVVPIESVNSFGKDAVVIADSSAVVAASSYPRVSQILDRKDSLLGKKVYTNAGEQLGSIGDMYFDERSGRILGLEVSGGAFGDLAKGTSYLPIEEIVRSGPDVVFIDPSAAEAIQSQVGGVSGALKDAQQKVGQAASDVRDKAEEARSDGQGGDGGAQEQDPEKALIGRRSGMDVTDENGGVVVANGQRVTQEHVDRAKASGNLSVLTEAVTMHQAQQSGVQVGAAAEQVGDTAASLWDRFTSKMSEVTDAQGQRVDEAQTKQKLGKISDSIGRPVTKVILSREDDVILDLGDIITHQAIQQSHDAGMLDSLLDNVYTGDVSFERDEMKSRQKGTAVVEEASGGASVVEELEQKVQSAEDQRQADKDQKRQQSEEDRQRRDEERQQRAEKRDAESQERDKDAEVQQAAQESSSDETGASQASQKSPEMSTVKT